MIIADMHIHSEFSCDSEEKMDDCIKWAIERNLSYICFTDHLDLNKKDWGYGYFNPEKYFASIEKMKEIYNGKIDILSGIEFSEAYEYPIEFEYYTSMPFDFILGSVHIFMDDKFASELVLENYPFDEVMDKYFLCVDKLAGIKNIDSIAHFDFPSRYYMSFDYNNKHILDILNKMIKNDIALEINFSSLRKGLNETMPKREVVKMYKDLGGKKITLGSDAHRLSEIGSFDYDYLKILSKKFDICIYKNRKPIVINGNDLIK